MLKITKTPYVKLLPERKPILNNGNYHRLVSAKIYELWDMVDTSSHYSFDDFCHQFNEISLVAQCFKDGYLYNHCSYEMRLFFQHKGLHKVVDDIKENLIPYYDNNN